MNLGSSAVFAEHQLLKKKAFAGVVAYSTIDANH